MRAVIFEQVNDPLVVFEVEPVALGPNDVRIATGSSGVCHSDLSYVKGLHALVAPIVLGHEGAGRVVEVGSAVSAVRLGDRVITSWASFCGHCYQCVHGRGHLCELQPSLATQSRALRDGVAIPAMTGVGSMAELMTVHETKVVRVDTDLPDEQLALIGCAVTTGVGAALWTAEVEVGSTVAVFGCGGVGQAAIQGAHLASAARIIAIDPVPLKRGAALRLGATEAIDPLSADAVRADPRADGGPRGGVHVRRRRPGGHHAPGLRGCLPGRHGHFRGRPAERPGAGSTRQSDAFAGQAHSRIPLWVRADPPGHAAIGKARRGRPARHR